MKSNRPVNLSMGQILSVNLRSPVAIASILHRVSGLIVFLLIPLLLWVLDRSLRSPESFAYVHDHIFGNLGVRFLIWVFLSGLIYHFVAGIKHLLADVGVAEGLQSGRHASLAAIIIAILGILAAFFWIFL